MMPWAVLAHLTTLAFVALLVARIGRFRQRCCAVFRRARTWKKHLREQVRSAFLLVAAPDRETLYAVATKDGVVVGPGSSWTTKPLKKGHRDPPGGQTCPVGGSRRLPCANRLPSTGRPRWRESL